MRSHADATHAHAPTQQAMATEELSTLVKTMVAEGVEAAKSKDGPTVEKYMGTYMKEGSVIIRPSGNPMDLATWKGMLTSEDVEVVSDEVVSIDTVIELAAGQVAVVVYTTHSVFKYKGTPNDDIAKFSATFEKQADGKWMCAHNHRGTGQKPA